MKKQSVGQDGSSDRQGSRVLIYRGGKQARKGEPLWEIRLKGEGPRPKAKVGEIGPGNGRKRSDQW